MEPVVYEESPLAEYLREGGNDSEVEWAPISATPDRRSLTSSESSVSSPSPTPYAPTGRPMVRARFRNKNSSSHRNHRRSYDDNDTSAYTEKLGWTEAKARRLSKRLSSLQSFRHNVSAAVAARLDPSDATKFLEQFRYAIIASQLLSGHSVLGRRLPIRNAPGAPIRKHGSSLLSTEGTIVTVLAALAVAVIFSWILGSSSKNTIPWKRIIVLLVLVAASIHVVQAYSKHKNLNSRQDEALSELAVFVSASHDFDSVIEATVSLVQEVELVSRGYHLSTPLPPISRMEDRSQTRKCLRLRKALLGSFADALPTYNQASDIVKGFSEQIELERYYDMYDISDFDMSDVRQGFNATEFEDPESLKTLKVLAARFHTTRKLFLCALLALDANGEDPDLRRWTAAVEALRGANKCTKSAFEKLQAMLSDAGSFPVPPTPIASPITPGTERWRSQLRKLDSLSTGIRGLQAKLHLLREESDRALADSNDLSELGPDLISQYDSIGAHLKELMVAWEDGRTALALGIDRNEKRISSMSTLLSATYSFGGFGGLETVGEGGTADAFKALTGESPPVSEKNESGNGDADEVFEAVAEPRPRPRSLMTREERIAKMKEEREQKAQSQSQLETTRGMLRELETVISLRPQTKQRLSVPISTGHVVSM